MLLYIQINKCNPHSSSKELLFAAEEDHSRKPQSIKMESCGASPNDTSTKQLLYPKAQGLCRSGGMKTVRARRTGFAVILCFLERTEATPTSLNQPAFLNMSYTRTTLVDIVM